MPEEQLAEVNCRMSISLLTGESKEEKSVLGVWLTIESNELDLRQWKGRKYSGYTRSGYRGVQARSV